MIKTLCPENKNIFPIKKIFVDKLNWGHFTTVFITERVATGIKMTTKMYTKKLQLKLPQVKIFEHIKKFASDH